MSTTAEPAAQPATPPAQGAIAPAASTTVAKSQRQTFKDWVSHDSFKAQLAAALPKHLTPDRFIRVLLTATMRTPLLLECTQESLFKGVFDCAAMGLEVDGRRAHLIPFKNNEKRCVEAQLIIDYKGLVELAMRAGGVSSIHADVVCENDEFTEETGQVVHKIDRRKPRGKPYAAYCKITFKDGGSKTEVMGAEDIEKIRQRSKAKNAGPWVSDPGEMWKKTVARRALKWVPLSPEIREHIEKDDEPVNVTTTAAGLAALVDGVQSAPAIEANAEVVGAAPVDGQKGGAS
jgi:recombination protein RecT